MSASHRKAETTNRPGIPFEKWQALGNDYIVIERRELPFELSGAAVAAICAPHTGIGSDGVLLISEATDPDLVADLRIFNPDGSEAELSGNGVREAVMYMRRSGWTGDDEFAIGTPAGVVRPRITSATECAVAMGRASLTSKDFPAGDSGGRGTLQAGAQSWEFQHVSIGNPQCAIEVDGSAADLRAVDLALVGPAIEGHELFPNRTNVSFWRRTGRSSIEARIFERGVGETLSSGTGATGAAVAASLRGVAAPVAVALDGGELTVEIGDELEIVLCGWAKPVFSGELSHEFIAELADL